MTIKDRLLEAIGDMPDLSQDVLTGILIEKVEMLRAELAAARDAVFKEAQRADDNARLAREEIHRVRNDPLAMAQGDFFFAGPTAVYVLTIGGGRVMLKERKGRIDYWVQQISREEFAKRVVAQ